MATEHRRWNGLCQRRPRPQVRRSAFSRGAVRFRLLQTANWKLVTRASAPAASTANSTACSLLEAPQVRGMGSALFFRSGEPAIYNLQSAMV